MLLAAHELVAAAHELDELARVDVGVAPVVDVLHELRGHLGQGARGGGAVDRLQGARERRELAGEGVAGRGAGGGLRGGGGDGGRRRVVGGHLHHDAVQGLDRVFELACGRVAVSGCGGGGGLGGSSYARGRRGLLLTLAPWWCVVRI